MRVLLAFDKFKDALSAREACATAAEVLRTKHPDWTLDLCPLTDGGEGCAETLGENVHARFVSRMVAGPREKTVTASVAFTTARSLAPAARRHLAPATPDRLALIGLASASGLELLAPGRRDPWHTTTYGTGELLRFAATEGADALLLGIGGSATNDLGCGALAALGFQFLDAAGHALTPPTPATWHRIARIDRAQAVPLPPLFIACDVTNPLLGPRGATTVFGPQKGLRAEDRTNLEAQASRLAALLCGACDQPISLVDTPGAGAAGGIAFGLMVAYGARLVPGSDLVSDWLDLPQRLAAADLIVTGEGRFDATSLGGKGPGAIATAARRLAKPIHIFAGSLDLPPAAVADFNRAGGLHVITPAGMPLAEALPRAHELLATALHAARLP